MDKMKVALVACVLASAAWCAWAENVVDDFETYTAVPNAGEVATGWTALDFGIQSVDPGGPYSEFDMAEDDQVVGQTITTGADGICGTLAQGDDVQDIAVGNGAADAVCITAGLDTVLDTTPAGDDEVVGDTITTGADGVCDTTAAGDDVQVIPVGGGQPGAVCISAGTNAVLDTDDSPDVWADKVAGQSGGWAQRITVQGGTRCLVKQFAVTPGQDYVISMKCLFSQPGDAPDTGGLMSWGYDLTGQVLDPTPKGPDASSTGTVVYQSIYNQPHNDKWTDVSAALLMGWVSTYETCTATGTVISVWIVVDDQDVWLEDGLQLAVDDLSITSYTPAPNNEVWNSDLEARSAARQEVPAGFYPNEWYKDDPTEEDGSLKPECNLAEVGHQVFSGEWCAAGGRYSDAIAGATGGMCFTARDLKDNTEYIFRVKIYETIKNRPTENIGPQGGVFIRCNLRGDLARQADGDSNYGYWPYGIGYYESIDYQDWSYPYRDRGWWDFEYSIITGDYQSGVNDERIEVAIWGFNGKMRTITYFDDITLVESGLDPFIEITDVSQLLSVPASGDVTITWTTDVASTSCVDYGTTEALGQTTGVVEAGVTNHSVPISGVDPDADFYYRVVSTAATKIDAYGRQRRVLAANDTLVNGDFEGGFYTRIREPMIVTGYHGVCETTAAPGDVQVIPVGKGVPDLVCILPGFNEVLDTTPVNDDQIVGETITTGADGVCDTTAAGDDEQEVKVGRGAHTEAVCVSAGPDGVMDTLRQGDDRSHESMRPVGWHFWGYSFGLLPGFQREDSQHVVRWMCQEANGAFYGFDGQEAAGFKEAGEVHTGDHSFGLWGCQANHSEVGGTCQTVKTTPGREYTLSTWVRGYDDQAENLNFIEFENLATQVGVDPQGGSDPTSASVVWNDKVFYGASDDEQIIAVGCGKPDTLGIDPGSLWGDNILQSTTGGDDVVVDVISWGDNDVLDTTPAGDDVVSPDWFWGYPAIMPGPNGTLDSTPAGDDLQSSCISTAANGINESTKAGDDFELISSGNGAREANCVGPGSDGVLTSPPDWSSDDREDGGFIHTGWDGVCQTAARQDEGPTRRYNYTWYQEDLVFTALSERATVFLSGHIHTGATYGPKERHTIWFDDVALTPNVDSLTWDSAQTGWNLMSLPIDPADPDPAVVFADLDACGNVIGTNLYRYSKASGYELYPSAQFTAMETGRAYWLRLTSVCDNTVSGTLLSAPQSIALDDGWNMFGMPLSTPVLWSGCQITDGVETKSIADAGTAGWIQTLIYYYTPAGYKSVKPDGTGDDDSLRAWVGYWFLTYQAGLSLIVQ